MCGRYTITKTPQQLAERFRLELLEAVYTPRYNAAPTQLLPVIVQGEDGKRRLVLMRWGLIPSWATDPAIGNRMINARAETLSTKPSFKEALQRRRCLIPADGFYEWRREGKNKMPMRMVTKAVDVFAFAGLWDRWKAPDGEEILSFTIITTEANAHVKHVHDRMPLVLAPEQEEVWLDARTSSHAIQAILQQPVSTFLKTSTVTSRVQSPL